MRPYGLIAAVVCLIFGALGYAIGSGLRASEPTSDASPSTARNADRKGERKLRYYRNPMGLPDTSAEPKKDPMGMDYIPVYEDEQAASAKGEGKVLYYRNPMGLPDTSPAPKKDSMGMDYIAVHENEGDDGATVKVSPERIQMTGVRTETVEKRQIMEPVRAPGILKVDESRLYVVSMRAESFIEKLYVDRTGQSVREGEPLFRVYSPQIVQAAVDSHIALRETNAAGRKSPPDSSVVRLRNLDVPDKVISELIAGGAMPRSVDWPSPVSGVVLEKKVIAGQRMAAGDTLYRIADISMMWVITDVPERDLDRINVGDPATIMLQAFPGQEREGRVDFIYPELNAETRTARVRIVVPNADERLRAEMYADVTIRSGNQQPTVAVPKSALIADGTRQVIFVDKGEGRFEPREVELGRRSDDYVEVTEGLEGGEKIVSTGSFLIDAESNIKSALKTFTAGQEPQS